jgi:hypothetical protein
MFLRRVKPALDAWRRRLIHETQSALLLGLLDPKRHPRIPTVEAGAGKFDRDWSERWWNSVLELDQHPASECHDNISRN